MKYVEPNGSSEKYVRLLVVRDKLLAEELGLLI